jgi:DNA repair exonuclease SbcCD ATPase subunit
MPDESRLVDKKEMTRVGRQIRLPWSKAVEIAVKSMKIRFGRSLVTTASIVLAIAFLMSILTGTTLTTSLRIHPARRLYWAQEDARLAGWLTDIRTAEARIQRLEAALRSPELTADLKDRARAELARTRSRLADIREKVANAREMRQQKGRPFTLPEVPETLDHQQTRARKDALEKQRQEAVSALEKRLLAAEYDVALAEHEIALRTHNIRDAQAWIEKLKKMRTDPELRAAELSQISKPVKKAEERIERLEEQLADPEEAKSFTSKKVQQAEARLRELERKKDDPNLPAAKRRECSDQYQTAQAELAELRQQEIQAELARRRAQLTELREREVEAQLVKQRARLANQPKTRAIQSAEARIRTLETDLEQLVPPAEPTGRDVREAEVRIRRLRRQLTRPDLTDAERAELRAELDRRLADLPDLKKDVGMIQYAATLIELADRHEAKEIEPVIERAGRLAGALTDLSAARRPQTDAIRAAEDRIDKLETRTDYPDLETEERQETQAELAQARTALKTLVRQETAGRLGAALGKLKDVAAAGPIAAQKDAVERLETQLGDEEEAGDDEHADVRNRLAAARMKLVNLLKEEVHRRLGPELSRAAEGLRKEIRPKLAAAHKDLLYLQKTEPSRIAQEKRRWPRLRTQLAKVRAQNQWQVIWRDLQTSEGYTDVELEVTEPPAETTYVKTLTRHMEPRDRWLAVLASLVCFVGIWNAMLMSVHERFREIGTMKCLGALESFIVKLYFLESSFVGMVGTLVGIGIGFLLTLLRAMFAFGFGTVLEYFDWSGALLSALCTILIGSFLSILAAIFPARSAAKMDPIEAMRVEE